MKISPAKSILHANDRQAAANLDRLTELRLLAVNVMASPGAGKTSVIKRMLEHLAPRWNLGVIEGDVASSIDADAIRAMGFPAAQINTNGGCHLDAAMVARAIEELKILGPGFLFIENVGNLICPNGFALGESLRLVIASVPEGDDKPVKYPAIFASADAVVLNKMDLIGHIDFRMDFFLGGVQAVNQAAPVFEVSCRSGQGIAAVGDWLLAAAARR